MSCGDPLLATIGFWASAWWLVGKWLRFCEYMGWDNGDERDAA